MPPYEDKKVEFIDELHLILSNCNGPIIVGGGGALTSLDLLQIRTTVG
jgi:hypothetical protein